MISRLPIPFTHDRTPLHVPRKVAALALLTAFLAGLGFLPLALCLLNLLAR